MRIIDLFTWRVLQTGTFISLLTVTSDVIGQTQAFIKILPRPEEKKVEVYIGNELFTSLLYADSLKKAILFPLIGADGVNLTRGWPLSPKPGDQIDHPHQMGVWLNYGDVNGADYWNNSTSIDSTKKAYGRIKFNEVVSAVSGRGKAVLTTRSTWYNPGSEKMLEELSTYTFSLQEGIRIIDRNTKLTAFKDILFKDNKEGFFAIRVARELEHPSDKLVKIYNSKGIATSSTLENSTGLFESSTGIRHEEVFGTRSAWLKLSGKVGAAPVALAIIDHPDNPGYPGYWMARGYGLFAINPLGAEVYSNGKERLNLRLKGGQEVVFDYRLVVSSALSNEKLDQLTETFKRQ